MTTREPLAAILAAAARGDPWNGHVDASIVADAQRHGVGPLLYRALRGSPAWEELPHTVREALRRIAAEAVCVDDARTAGDRDVIAAFADAGIDTLVFKGAALAHRHYSDSWLRPRVDADLLIRARDRDRAAAVCEQLGCVRAVRPDGEYATHQFTYNTVVRGVRLEYDIHWKIADPHVFADVLGFDELARESVPLPGLGARARAIGDAHAWLVACTHRVAHHFDRDWLLFLYDIDLLSRRLDEPVWRCLVALAHEKRIAAVCARSLALAMERLDTPVPSGVREALDSAVDEPSAAYLARRLRRVDILQSDWRALGGWRARARLVREHLLPSPDYVMRSYGTNRTALLPALYLHRIVRGAGKWFRPLRSGES